MHAFRLGLALGVASLLPLDESLFFADSRPDYFVQTWLDKKFDFEGNIDDGTIIPMLIRGSKVWPQIRLAVLRFADSKSTGRSADVVLTRVPFLVPHRRFTPSQLDTLLKAEPGTAQMESG
jgi:hypothetical protein